ncbi:DmpA family aminopeptidase [Streptomyces cavernicola]|uniref:P1 family peptidase n=1 Tax=Streptomyces cavernicola TaxID=3043613 RepID=A0ABT6SCI8_9ACTN|nr:P1 family peptidase [Streptomyces sp. B-S-A6]MDI3405675.1 P1 family peptidase [Streptomyces sp. B-S-A6]
MRARDLGIVIGEHTPGHHNAITDVPGVRVGHATLVEGSGPLRVGEGPVRTGVTVVMPHEDIWSEPVFAAPHRLNGSGEITGLEWIRESGQLTSPIALTNTHSVGVVRDALVQAQVHARGTKQLYWCLPVVGETYDGLLNDINGHHVRPDHFFEALASASDGPVAEGGVGGGTGMICHEFKGGIGTASRVRPTADGAYTVGVLVQANYGRRHRLRINGVPVGELIGSDVTPVPQAPEMWEPGSGSIIVVVATDAPLLPHQCARLAQRAGLAIGRLGGTGEQYSGDLFLAFSTGNRGLPPYAYDEYVRQDAHETPLRMAANAHLTPLFDMVIEATEEAIVNSLVAAETMVGRDGVTAHALNHDRLRAAMGLA